MSTVTASDKTAEPVAPEFDEIFREYHPLIYRTAYGVTGSVQDAEDIVQTVLFRVLRLEISLDNTRNPKGYLYRTTVNLALGVVRSEEHMSTVTACSIGKSHRRPSAQDTPNVFRRLAEKGGLRLPITLGQQTQRET